MCVYHTHCWCSRAFRLATTGSLDEANKTVEGVSSNPQQLLDTPAEQQGMENIGLAMKPFKWREGWGKLAEQQAFHMQKQY